MQFEKFRENSLFFFHLSKFATIEKLIDGSQDDNVKVSDAEVVVNGSSVLEPTVPNSPTNVLLNTNPYWTGLLNLKNLNF